VKKLLFTLQAWPAWHRLGGAKLLTSDQQTSEIQEHPASCPTNTCMRWEISFFLLLEKGHSPVQKPL